MGYHDDQGFGADWVSAQELRNHSTHDPLLDWLNLYGADRRFIQDDELETYREDCNFVRFLVRKNREFTTKVVDHLRAHLGACVALVGTGTDHTLAERQEQTQRLIDESCGVIVQGVLRHDASETYGTPDLLIRADLLNGLIDEPPLTDAETGAMGYVVLGVEYSSIELRAKTKEAGGGDLPKLVRAAASERALAHHLGRSVGRAFLLGRRVTIGKEDRALPWSCFARLAPVTAASCLGQADQAAQWIREVRRDGRNWDPFHPHRRELIPNLSSTRDFPWHHAKRAIAAQTKPVNALYQVGWDKEYESDSGRFARWDDPGVDAGSLARSYKEQSNEIRAANTTPGFVLGPERVKADSGNWRAFDGVEFYVDFETVTDLDDVFATFPIRGGSPRIFMVGCGHLKNGEWRFECFIADDLTDESERRVLDDWFLHMIDIAGTQPTRLYHWSQAEESFYSKAYNSALKRLGDRGVKLDWYDLLTKVARAEPVVVSGAMAFGLKAIAKAMHAHGLIETNWEDGPMDGLAASVAAWNCANRTHPMHADPLMNEVRKYNEVDCRVMCEILDYLRKTR